MSIAIYPSPYSVKFASIYSVIINKNQLLFQLPRKDTEFLSVCRVKFHHNILEVSYLW